MEINLYRKLDNELKENMYSTDELRYLQVLGLLYLKDLSDGVHGNEC